MSRDTPFLRVLSLNTARTELSVPGPNLSDLSNRLLQSTKIERRRKGVTASASHLIVLSKVPQQTQSGPFCVSASEIPGAHLLHLGLLVHRVASSSSSPPPSPFAWNSPSSSSPFSLPFFHPPFLFTETGRVRPPGTGLHVLFRRNRGSAAIHPSRSRG